MRSQPPVVSRAPITLTQVGDGGGRTANIVFVHGLGGDPKGTWTNETSKSFWPEWIQEDFEFARVWTLGYPASPFDFTDGNSGLPSLAIPVLDILRQRSLFDSPLCFVAHSLGGLLVKQLISEAVHTPTYQAAVSNLKGIVFLGTPHRGAAPRGLRRRGLFLPTARVVRNLARGDEHLLLLNRMFNQIFERSPFEVLVLQETRPVSLFGSIPLVGRWLRKLPFGRLMVVDETAGDAELERVRPEPVDEDHFSICKPESQDSRVFERCSEFLARVLRASPEMPRPPAARSMGNLPVPADPVLFEGRDEELQELEEAFRDPQTIVYEIIADGGVGKSSLVWHWLQRQASPLLTLPWSFYLQGQGRSQTDSHGFLRFASDGLRDLELNEEQRKDSAFVASAVADAFLRNSGVIVLDGIEPLLQAPRDGKGKLNDPGLAVFLKAVTSNCSDAKARLVILTTRWGIEETSRYDGVCKKQLNTLSTGAGAKLLAQFRLASDTSLRLNVGPGNDPSGLESEFEAAVKEFGGHALSLILLASYLLKHHQGNIRERARIPKIGSGASDSYHRHARRIMHSYTQRFLESDTPVDRAVLRILTIAGVLGCNESTQTVFDLCSDPGVGNCESACSLADLREATHVLRTLRLPSTDQSDQIDFHPLIREQFADRLRENEPENYRSINLAIAKRLTAQAPKKPDSLPGMERHLRSIVYACRAGDFVWAYELLDEQVLRGHEAFAIHTLGGHAVVLSALDAFFPAGWRATDHLLQGGLHAGQVAILLILMGSCLAATRGYSIDETREYFRRAEELAASVASHKVQFRAQWGLVAYNLMRGHGTPALETADTVDRLAADTLKDTESRILADRAIATTRFFVPEFVVVRARADRARRMLHSVDVSVRRQLAAAFIVDPIAGCISYRSLVALHDGEFALSLDLASEAESAAGEISHSHTMATVLAYKAWLAQGLGDAELCLQVAQQMSNECVQHGIPFWSLVADLLQGWGIGRCGEAPKGIRKIDQALRRWRETGADLLLPLWYSLLVDLLSLKEETAKRGLEEADRGLDTAARHGFSLWKPELLRVKALCQHRLGDREAAEESLRQALAIATEIGSIGLRVASARSLAELYETDGRWEQLRELLETTRPFLRDEDKNCHCIRIAELFAQI